MNLHSAKLLMARYMVEEAQHWQRASEAGWSAEDEAQLDQLKRRREVFGQLCAADPRIRPHLTGCWMVDIHIAHEFGTRRDPIGSLPREVFAFVEEEMGLHAPRACGEEGWDLGVPCPEDQANRLCDALYERFSDEIYDGSITIGKKFWDWRFADLRAWDQAETFLEKAAVN